MNAALVSLARDKQLLLAHSALCRLRLRRRSLDLRQSLTWSSAAVDVTSVPALRRFGFGLVASQAGLYRTARFIRLAGRIVLFAKLAASVVDFAGRDRPPAVRGIAIP